MPTEKPLVGLNVEQSLLDRIDDFRFEHRFPSRAAAIKWLLEWALEQHPQPPNSHALRSAKKCSG